MPRLSTRDLNRLRTLAAAGEVIENLRTKVAQLKAGSNTPVKLLLRRHLRNRSLPTAMRSGLSTNGSLSPPGSTRLSPTPMPVNYPRPEKKALPPAADTSVVIQRILDVTNIDDLRSMLDNPIHTRLQMACLYTELKSGVLCLAIDNPFSEFARSVYTNCRQFISLRVKPTDVEPQPAGLFSKPTLET